MVDKRELNNLVLALLFASDEPLSVKRIAGVLGEASESEIKAVLNRLKHRFEDEKSSIMLECIAGGFQLSTRPEYAAYIARLYTGRRKQRLSRAGLEALAIIAYKQPITRADIEHLRGVSCGGVISTLMERSLIRIAGKARILGAPFLYATSREFLEYLGLNSLGDLPSMEELEAILREREEIGSEEEVGPGSQGQSPSPEFPVEQNEPAAENADEGEIADIEREKS